MVMGKREIFPNQMERTKEEKVSSWESFADSSDQSPNAESEEILENPQKIIDQLKFENEKLRRKFEDDPICPTYILTEPGVGYRFISDC